MCYITRVTPSLTFAAQADRGTVAPVECPHAHPLVQLWRRLDASPAGLSEQQAAARRSTSAQPRPRSRLLSAVGELAESLVEPLQLLLIAVGGLSAVFGQTRDAIAIFAIIGLVAAVEAISKARAKRALGALSQLSAVSARVRRDGVLRRVAVSEVVVGDVLVISAGDVVGADARVIVSDGLAIDESALTGEPVSAAKGSATVAEDAPLAQRSSMLYAATAAVAGAGEALVVAVGVNSEIGQLRALVADATEPATPLQGAMAELARAALMLALAASILVPLLGVLRGQSARQMLLDGLTLAFATIPEELPILVTVLVAVGGLRLAKHGVLLRKLRAAETVGAITVLVSDKTGTLTENRLQLAHVEGDRERVLDGALAAHGSAPAQDPLDRALKQAARSRPTLTQVRRFAFDPVRKCESAVMADGHLVRVCVKGAPEAVLAASTITNAKRDRVLICVAQLAEDGLRMIAVAQRDARDDPVDAQAAERDLEFLGLVAFSDPLRDGVTDALASLARAGVRTVVVSGDHPKTVAAIARQAGLRDFDMIVGGTGLAQLNDEQLARHLARPLVVARATPQDKLRVVRVLQTRGERVAVTGDGINDAPALAAADVGIAMGARGTDLAREAADLILTTDAYPTIVTAVAGGRGLGAQLRRAVAFYLGAKVALVTVIAVPLALGLPAPFEPVHIVLLELFMDLGASVAFVAEPPAANAMRQPPRNPSRPFLDRAQVAAIALTAVALTAAVLPAFLLVSDAAGRETGTAAAIGAWLVAHAAIAWSLRSRPRLAWRENIAFPAWALTATLTAIVFAVTPAAGAIGIEQLSTTALAITTAAATVGVALAATGRRVLSLPQRL